MTMLISLYFNASERRKERNDVHTAPQLRNLTQLFAAACLGLPGGRQLGLESEMTHELAVYPEKVCLPACLTETNSTCQVVQKRTMHRSNIPALGVGAYMAVKAFQRPEKYPIIAGVVRWVCYRFNG